MSTTAPFFAFITPLQGNVLGGGGSTLPAHPIAEPPAHPSAGQLPIYPPSAGQLPTFPPAFPPAAPAHPIAGAPGGPSTLPVPPEGGAWILVYVPGKGWQWFNLSALAGTLPVPPAPETPEPKV